MALRESEAIVLRTYRPARLTCRPSSSHAWKAESTAPHVPRRNRSPGLAGHVLNQAGNG